MQSDRNSIRRGTLMGRQWWKPRYCRPSRTGKDHGRMRARVTCHQQRIYRMFWEDGKSFKDTWCCRDRTYSWVPKESTAPYHRWDRVHPNLQESSQQVLYIYQRYLWDLIHYLYHQQGDNGLGRDGGKSGINNSTTWQDPSPCQLLLFPGESYRLKHPDLFSW